MIKKKTFSELRIERNCFNLIAPIKKKKLQQTSYLMVKIPKHFPLKTGNKAQHCPGLYLHDKASSRNKMHT